MLLRYQQSLIDHTTVIEDARAAAPVASGPGARAASFTQPLTVDLHDALSLLAAGPASEYPSLVSEVPEIVIRIRASC